MVNIFDEYTRSVLKVFNECSVDYLLVGGYAVNFHGYRRMTGDLNLWIKPDNGNRAKIIKAFSILNIESEVLLELSKMDFTKHLAFMDGEEPFRIDFMTYISGVNFDEAQKDSIQTEIDEISIKVIHLNHLLISKMTSDRLKDKLDVEELQKIRNKKS